MYIYRKINFCAKLKLKFVVEIKLINNSFPIADIGAKLSRICAAR